MFFAVVLGMVILRSKDTRVKIGSVLILVILALGFWQLERREWKLEILDRIAVNQAAAPLTLDQLLEGDPLRHEYGRVTVGGARSLTCRPRRRNRRP